MKKLSMIALIIAIVGIQGSFIQGRDKFEYVDQLPAHSKLKCKCQNYERSLFDNNIVERKCDLLNDRMGLLISTQHTISDFLLDNEYSEAHNPAFASAMDRDIANAIRKLLKDEINAVRWQEYSDVYTTIATLQIKEAIAKKKEKQIGNF